MILWEFALQNSKRFEQSPSKTAIALRLPFQASKYLRLGGNTYPESDLIYFQTVVAPSDQLALGGLVNHG